MERLGIGFQSSTLKDSSEFLQKNHKLIFKAHNMNLTEHEKSLGITQIPEFALGQLGSSASLIILKNPLTARRLPDYHKQQQCYLLICTI